MPQDSKPKSKIAATSLKGPQERSENSSRKKTSQELWSSLALAGLRVLHNMRQTLDQSVILWRAVRQKTKKQKNKKKDTADQNKYKGPFWVLPTAIRLTSETFFWYYSWDWWVKRRTFKREGLSYIWCWAYTDCHNKNTKPTLKLGCVIFIYLLPQLMEPRICLSATHFWRMSPY